PRVPPPDARVALVAPAGPLPEGALDRARALVERLGWRPLVGRHAAGRHGYLAAPDEARLEDLNAALSSPEVDVVWLLRGGYGTLRIVDRVDLDPLLARPRPLVGFSDNTVLHLAAHDRGIVTFHGPHPAAIDLSDFSIGRLAEVLRP